MPTLRVAGAQIPVNDHDVAANEREILSAIAFARDQKADILLTPEGSLSGYHASFDQNAVASALDRVRAAAREANLGLALGTCFVEPDDGKCYNQLRFYGKDGGYSASTASSCAPARSTQRAACMVKSPTTPPRI